MTEHVHDPATQFRLYDARGIYCGLACRKCEAEKRRGFRSEIFTDPNYETTEAIEED